MNWPPSRGPKPPREVPVTEYPDPVIEGPLDRIHGDEEDFEPVDEPRRDLKPMFIERNGQIVRSEFPEEETLITATEVHEQERLRRYAALSTNVSVVHLLEAGAMHSRRLVQGVSLHGQRKGRFEGPPPRAVSGYLSYPLNKVARVTVKPWTRAWGGGEPREFSDTGWVLWCLAKAYEQIYAQHEAYGVWGHEIGDLIFERLVIKDDRFQIWVGS